MRGLSLTPIIELEEDGRLILVESHFGKWSLVGVLLGVTGVFLFPGIFSGEWLGVVIGLVLAVLVGGIPFLVVLWFSRYRRLEIVDDEEVVSTTVFPLRPSRSVTLSWEDIQEVTCQRTIGSSKNGYVYTIRVKLITTEGRTWLLLKGDENETVMNHLRHHLGDLFSIVS